MAAIRVKKSIDAPAAKLWKLVADFGDISWMPAGTTARLEGEGVGMARLIGAGDKPIREVLEARDAASKTLVYTIPQNIPFPVRDYRSTMIVREAGAGSELDWSCTFEPDGVSEAEAKQSLEGLYGVMIGWIADRVRAI